MSDLSEKDIGNFKYILSNPDEFDRWHIGAAETALQWAEQIQTLQASLAAKEKELEGYKLLAKERGEFIANGVEFDFIQLPESKDDTANEVFERTNLTDEAAANLLTTKKNR